MPPYKYKNTAGKTLWYASFRYQDWTGETKRKLKRGFATRREAMDYEREFIDRQAQDPSILFSSLVKNYMEDMKSRLKPTTYENKESMIRTKLLPYLGNLRICDISPIIIRKWQKTMMDDFNFSQTYLRSLNAQLSAIMNYAVRYYQLASNPCKMTELMGKSKADEMKIWTVDQYQEFIKYEKKTAYRVAFDTLFYSGIREGELLALTPESIKDLDLLHITANFQIVDGEELFLTPKTEGSVRDVTIPHSLYQELKEYARGMMLRKTDRIFYFQKAGLISEFHRVTERAGLPPIRIHDLRHSHVSMLIQMGVPIVDISHRIGHDNVSTTLNTYSHMYPGGQANIASGLEHKRSSSPTENGDETSEKENGENGNENPDSE